MRWRLRMSKVNCFSSKHNFSFQNLFSTYEFTCGIIGMMTHLSIDPACDTSLLVNKLVERFILRFTRGNPRQGVRRLYCLCIHRARLLFGRFLSSWTFVGRNGCEEHVWWIVSLPPPSTATWAVASLRCSNRLQELRDLSVNTATTTVIHCKQHSKSPNAAFPLFTSTAKWNWRRAGEWNHKWTEVGTFW